jgi:hypothetical protein
MIEYLVIHTNHLPFPGCSLWAATGVSKARGAALSVLAGKQKKKKKKIKHPQINADSNLAKK